MGVSATSQCVEFKKFIVRSAEQFDQMTFVLVGIYLCVWLTVPVLSLAVFLTLHQRWEWFISLDFDWAFVTGRKRFRWTMVSLIQN